MSLEFERVRSSLAELLMAPIGLRDIGHRQTSVLEDPPQNVKEMHFVVKIKVTDCGF